MYSNASGTITLLDDNGNILFNQSGSAYDQNYPFYGLAYDVSAYNSVTMQFTTNYGTNTSAEGIYLVK